MKRARDAHHPYVQGLWNDQAGQALRTLIANPGAIISFRDFERLIEAFGWQHKRTRGSHRHYVHRDVQMVLTINPDGKSAHRYQVRLLLELVEEYGLHMGS